MRRKCIVLLLLIFLMSAVGISESHLTTPEITSVNAPSEYLLENFATNVLDSELYTLYYLDFNQSISSEDSRRGVGLFAGGYMNISKEYYTYMNEFGSDSPFFWVNDPIDLRGKNVTISMKWKHPYNWHDFVMYVTDSSPSPVLGVNVSIPTGWCWAFGHSEGLTYATSLIGYEGESCFYEGDSNFFDVTNGDNTILFRLSLPDSSDKNVTYLYNLNDSGWLTSHSYPYTLTCGFDLRFMFYTSTVIENSWFAIDYVEVGAYGERFVSGQSWSDFEFRFVISGEFGAEIIVKVFVGNRGKPSFVTSDGWRYDDLAQTVACKCLVSGSRAVVLNWSSGYAGVNRARAY